MDGVTCGLVSLAHFGIVGFEDFGNVDRRLGGLQISLDHLWVNLRQFHLHGHLGGHAGNLLEDPEVLLPCLLEDHNHSIPW